MRCRTAGVALAAAVLAASATAGAVSGCSTTDDLSDRLTKGRYALEMKALADRVRKQTRLAIELVKVGSLAEAAPLIDKAVGEFDEIVARLEENEPPDEIAAVHDRLTAALGGASSLLTDARDAVKGSDIASLILLAPQLSDFRDRFRGIVQDYEAQGYDLEQPAPAAP
jgi:hypothetical protein